MLIGWRDKNGREGEIPIDKFNYVPGSPLDVTDGLKFISVTVKLLMETLLQ